jgi:long-chain acyl-CoA synthetase
MTNHQSPTHQSPTIIHHLIKQAQENPNHPAYFVRNDSHWQSTSYVEYLNQVKQVAKALISFGVDAGGCTCILGQNRPEWTIFDLASMMIGAIPAGIYVTSSAKECAYIIDHSESKCILVENLSQWQKIKQIRSTCPHLEKIIIMDTLDVSIDSHQEILSDPQTIYWQNLFEMNFQGFDEALNQRINRLMPDQCATLIYTSGTTGHPKGVMLSHHNLTWTAQLAQELVHFSSQDYVLSYLPLSHIAEQMFSIHCVLTVGGSVYFSRGMHLLKEDLVEVQPTVFFGVPRVWEKMHQGIEQGIANLTGWRKKLAHFVMQVSYRVNLKRCKGEKAGFFDELCYSLFKNRLSKIKQKLGLSKTKMCISGAAPIQSNVLFFFLCIDVIIHEIYGQSEACGPTSFNFPKDTQLGTVGKPIPHTEVKLLEDEILVKGPHVFMGYFKDQDATTACMHDGYLCSGDLGAFDEEGFLKITGRKKEIIITAGGKNISPKNIELSLCESEWIEQAMIVGDQRKYLVALIVPRLETRTTHTQEDVRSAIQKEIDRVNADLSQVEQVKKFAILDREFSLANEELTPTLKMKRKKIEQNFKVEIDHLYQDSHETN